MHKHFEGLCALAATGQISGESMAVLDAHVKECKQCRAFLEELTPVKSHVAPVLAASHARTYEPPEGIRERFLQRAAESGIDLHPGPVLSAAEEIPEVPVMMSPLKRVNWFASLGLTPQFAMGTAAAVLLVAVGYWIASEQLSPAAPRITIATVPPPVISIANGSRNEGGTESAGQASIARIQALTAQIEILQKEKQDLSNRLTLAAQSAANDATLEQRVKSISAQLQAADDRVATLSDQLTAERTRATTSDALLLAQQKATEDANAKAVSLQAQLDREPVIQKTDGSGMLAARNLHIVDVYDTEANGSRKKPFGRVFYVEGKSLVFYAYDLPTKVHDKKVSFKVWGEQAGLKSVTFSLGAMQSDAPGQGRWLLTCNDPKILARINAIYLTTEPTEKPGSAPQGQKLMYAFLGNANHP